MPAAYDAIADEYAAQYAGGPPEPQSVLGLALRSLLDLAGPVEGQEVCDLGCGEGYLARQMAALGASVTAVDLSARLIEIARRSTSSSRIRYLAEDVQELPSVADAGLDLVVSSLALMDMPDLDAVYRSARRIVRPGGAFVFSLTHPCFQSLGTDVELTPEVEFAARRVRRYAAEGYWRSHGKTTLRGRVGAYHRTLSTYLNGLAQHRFALSHLVEPVLPEGEHANPYAQGMTRVPSLLVVRAVAA
jgi:SAM-dependent methyltransferase